ncbi:hypothetical protein HK44_028770 [Pseudomonas fluorescens HK44]|uniref:Uncharacterized protein n=1 Tax=Pseudomonas fluorescens HK44 TaxID=1042209 RepID=A0A010S2I1_PSEFL|nr:hypothetical protein HK44_028770 [Pseudomonas fluorescens HK44]
MTDHLKILLLRAGMGTTLKQVEVPQAIHGQLQPV